MTINSSQELATTPHQEHGCAVVDRVAAAFEGHLPGHSLVPGSHGLQLGFRSGRTAHLGVKQVEVAPDLTGSVNRFVGIVLDETERQKSAQELERAQAELANICRLTALDTVMRSLAHELRQPLTAIRGYSAALRRFSRGASDNSKIAQAVNGIDKSATLASEILARSETPSWTRIEARNESLGAIVRAAASVADGTVAVEFAIPAEADNVQVDRVHLQQVVINLIGNAAEALREGGGSRIVVSAVPLSEEEVEVRVSDDGPGIPHGIRDRLFSPFVTTKPSGTGIGLSICRTIIEAHGGRIWLASGPDGGAVIAFTLPRA